jgi:hypothetical protein
VATSMAPVRTRFLFIFIPLESSLCQTVRLIELQKVDAQNVARL